MNVGLIARADSRGIGYQTHEFWKAMQPAKTAVVDLRDRKWPNDWSRFPDADVFTPVDWRFDEDQARGWLAGLDVVFIVETPYDWEFLKLAESMGVRTVIQGNPEFYQEGKPEPSGWWWPTPWLQHRLPSGPVVPVPVPDDWPHQAGSPDDDLLTFVHVAGHRARADRNGTDIMSRVVRSLNFPCRVRIYGQDGSLVGFKGRPGVDVELFPDGVEDRRDIYRGAHVVVLPRRYGGLSLPAQEAMASGCAVIMPECSPNDFWPTVRVPAMAHGAVHTKLGNIRMFTADAPAINRKLREFHDDRHLLDVTMGMSSAWALHNRWEFWRPKYGGLFECV